MSFPDLSFSLSARAKKDMREILAYTVQTWGKPQFFVYQKKLDNAFRAIAERPSLGRGKSNLPPNTLVYPVGKHVILYRITEGGIYVLRVLHERMDANRHMDC